MCKKLSIVQFVLTGVLDELTIGAEHDLLKKLLGRPDDVGKGIGKSKIDSYLEGGLQIANINGKVILIALYLNKINPQCDKPFCVVNDLPQGIDRDKQQFLQWLKSNGVVFNIREAGGAYTSIDIIGGASAGFESDTLVTVQIGE